MTLTEERDKLKARNEALERLAVAQMIETARALDAALAAVEESR